MKINLNKKTEEEVKRLFRKWGKEEKNYSDEYIESQIKFIFTTDTGFQDRFNFLKRYIKPSSYESLLISGSSVGSEIIQAKEFGFKKISGTEVTKIYIDISKKRLAGIKDVKLNYYDGTNLPYKDVIFTCIMSGHIIEHTKQPAEYIKEHFRVLKNGGLFFLEFPDRYHCKELHTQTISFEWMPRLIRKLFLVVLSSNLNPSKSLRRKFYDVLKTLVPVSIRDIKNWIRKSGYNAKVIGVQRPLPGFIRVIFEKIQ